jgi:hypothetical protein
MKGILAAIVFASTAQLLVGQTATHVPLRIVSDWTNHHVLYPDSKDFSMMSRIEQDPRWLQNWHLRHPETWWLGPHPGRDEGDDATRDWSISLSASASTSSFEPRFDFYFNFGTGFPAGYGTVSTTDVGGYTTYNGFSPYLATAGTLTVTGGHDVGSYPLYPEGPAAVDSPSGYFEVDNLLYPSVDPTIDMYGLLFTNGSTFEINIWGNGAGNYEFYDNKGYNVTVDTGQPFVLDADPGGGQTFPAKFVFDVTAAPSCTSDFVAVGVPANPVSGGQANIVGLNNLYSSSAAGAYCSGSGPKVMFAYASGSGQVPASLAISQTGTQIAYIENLPSGSSYFHVLTIGTTGTNGTSATAAVVPGASGGNNAVDQRALLSPNDGGTNQSSTNAPFVLYTPNDANDVAYATTYSWSGTGSGYLYKLGNVFNGSAVPTIIWSVAIDAVPSTPVYDSISNKVFFTDSMGRIDYVTDTGASPSVVYGAVVAAGTTSENPVVVDSTHEMIYASFNSNRAGGNALIVQAPTNMASTVSVPVGTASTTYTGPYAVDFNNAWYTGSGTSLMYVAGTGSGTVPTLYSVGFNGSGVMNSSTSSTAALASGTADSSPVTEFYNTTLQKDYLFVGVTDNCIATSGGGTAGCVMSLDITSGFPTVNASTTALAATGGTSGIIVDNNSSLTQASSIYYATKTGVTLVKATQSGLK